MVVERSGLVVCCALLLVGCTEVRGPRDLLSPVQTTWQRVAGRSVETRIVIEPSPVYRTGKHGYQSTIEWSQPCVSIEARSVDPPGSTQATKLGFCVEYPEPARTAAELTNAATDLLKRARVRTSPAGTVIAVGDGTGTWQTLRINPAGAPLILSPIARDARPLACDLRCTGSSGSREQVDRCEAELRARAGVERAVCVPLPRGNCPDELVAFVSISGATEDVLRSLVAAHPAALLVMRRTLPAGLPTEADRLQLMADALRQLEDPTSDLSRQAARYGLRCPWNL